MSCASRHKSEHTSSKSGYIQPSATVQGHSHPFSSSNSTSPRFGLQIRWRFHHILPVRASIAQAEQPSSRLYCYQTRVSDDQNSADAVCRRGTNQNSLGGLPLKRTWPGGSESFFWESEARTLQTREQGALLPHHRPPDPAHDRLLALFRVCLDPSAIHCNGEQVVPIEETLFWWRWVLLRSCLLYRDFPSRQPLVLFPFRAPMGSEHTTCLCIVKKTQQLSTVKDKSNPRFLGKLYQKCIESPKPKEETVRLGFFLLFWHSPSVSRAP